MKTNVSKRIEYIKNDMCADTAVEACSMVVDHEPVLVVGWVGGGLEAGVEGGVGVGAGPATQRCLLAHRSRLEGNMKKMESQQEEIKDEVSGTQNHVGIWFELSSSTPRLALSLPPTCPPTWPHYPHGMRKLAFTCISQIAKLQKK